MASKETHELLKELRKQLDEMVITKPEAKEKVVKLTELIDQAVEADESETLDPEELRKHLKDSVLYFEVSHPTLTAAISNIINTLNAMGI
jgi:hypothetical protein